jgi:adenylate cyclase
LSVFSDSVEVQVQTILNTGWDIRDGNTVPTTDTVKLTDGAVRVNATYLYADLADSSGAAQKLKKEVTGKLVRSYLDAASRIIKHYEGEIRSFDGDRVMGIFIGNSKNTNAIKTALGINWAMDKVLDPKFLAKWPALNNNWTPAHGVGIDTGEALIVRGGVRNSNDLVSIGSAPNVAAKLSSLRGAPDVYITHAVYNNCSAAAKATDGKNMWTDYGTQAIGGCAYKVKGSTWRWTP